MPDVELLVELLVTQAEAEVQQLGRGPGVVFEETVEEFHASVSVRQC